MKKGRRRIKYSDIGVTLVTAERCALDGVDVIKEEDLVVSDWSVKLSKG